MEKYKVAKRKSKWQFETADFREWYGKGWAKDRKRRIFETSHDNGKKKLDLIMLIASKSSIKGTLDAGKRK